MKKRGITLIWLFILLISCNNELSNNKINDYSAYEFIEKIKTYQHNIKLKDKPEYRGIDTSTFNVSDYLKLFNKIKIRPGLKCYFNYMSDINGGHPIFYAETDSFNYDDYIESKINALKPKDAADQYFFYNQVSDEFENDSTKKAANNMIPEDSKEGYLQYLFFHEMGNQFGLYWHDLVFEKSIINSKPQINKIYNEYLNNNRFTCKKDELDSLLKINPEVYIKLESKRCLITWYEIETHHGIYKRTYSIKRDFPYHIDRIEDATLVRIHCHIIY